MRAQARTTARRGTESKGFGHGLTTPRRPHRRTSPAHSTERLFFHAGLGLLMVMTLAMSLSLGSCQVIEDELGSAGQSAARPPEPPITAGPDADSERVPGPMRDTARDLAPLGEPLIRVRLIAAAAGVELASPTGLSVSIAEAPVLASGSAAKLPGVGGLAINGVAPANAPVRVSLENGHFTLRPIAADRILARYPASAGVIFSPASADYAQAARLPVRTAASSQQLSAGKIAVNGREYPGRIRLLPRSDAAPGAFDVIELVEIEQYLVGVVSKEMYSNWRQTAFEVQAVCARTYALHERARSIATGKTFDVEASEADQAYAGDTANPAARTAVQATRGVVLMHQGRLLRAYYSSTCGGRTAAARDTWPTSRGFEFNLAPPIQENFRQHFCSAAPRYQWTIDRDRAELTRRIRAFGQSQRLMVRQLKELRAIEVMGENQAGRPNRFRVVDNAGKWFQLSGEELRLACNTPAPGLPPIDSKSRVFSSDFSVRVRGDAVTFSGRGFGHGVGMCQYCVKSLAEQGRDWRTIVQLFYPGAATTKLY